MLSFQGGILVPAYTASKSGIAGVTKALACEWAKERININAVAPGYIATENTRPLREDETRNQSILARIPEGRWGDPEDIAGACLFLSSKDADYMNGTIMNVDGGWLSR
jgi:2-deoxy-D-gluconate 3-dehydrogenase